MRRVSIRELSGDVVGDVAHGEFLGITNNGALAGLLVPLTDEILQRLAHSDADDTAARVRQAEADIAAGHLPEDLQAVLREPAPELAAPASFSRVSIRDLKGDRLAEAARTGERLIVTRDRVAVALFLPVSVEWVDRLVEASVGRFLDGTASAKLGVTPQMIGEGRSILSTRPVSHGSSGREFLQQRAIGIRIIGDAPDHRERLVGVVTDMLARPLVGPFEQPLATLDEGDVFAQILTLVDSLRAHMADTDVLAGVGVEIGGHVDQGRVAYSANARWDHFPLADLLSSSLGVPVVLENDANSLAMYERGFHGIDDKHFAVVLLTHLGVGCGLVLDGRLYRGARGMAGELGHVSVEFGDPHIARCRCMNPGCLEGVATPRAIEITLHEQGFEGNYATALQRIDDERVRSVFALAGASLGRGISSVLNLLNPSAVVIYGPSELIGQPRRFYADSHEYGFGLAALYTREMIETIRTRAFSSGADECQFFVRSTTDDQGARAAAACLIHSVLDQPIVDRIRQIALR
jgi:predicted NBD/HSP70 family sugar kinase/antitoxin (DNA-binding transcriptional repressor) of toxin-antitoxin stability system